MNEKIIEFASSKDEYGCFGNMNGDTPIKIGEVKLHGSEILYQCLKYCNHPEIQQELIRINHPLKAKWHQKPYVKQGLVDPKFDDNKVDIMKLCLCFKLNASAHGNKIFFNKLQNSIGYDIIELSKKDTFWGVVNGTGENQLGKCLMWLRDEFFIKGLNMDEIVTDLVHSNPYLKELKFLNETVVFKPLMFKMLTYV